MEDIKTAKDPEVVLIDRFLLLGLKVGSDCTSSEGYVVILLEVIKFALAENGKDIYVGIGKDDEIGKLTVTYVIKGKRNLNRTPSEIAEALNNRKYKPLFIIDDVPVDLINVEQPTAAGVPITYGKVVRLATAENSKDNFIGIETGQDSGAVKIVGTESDGQLPVELSLAKLRELNDHTFQVLFGPNIPVVLLGVENDDVNHAAFAMFGPIVAIRTVPNAKDFYVGAKNDQRDGQIIVTSLENKGGKWVKKLVSETHRELKAYVKRPIYLDREVVRLGTVVDIKKDTHFCINYSSSVRLTSKSSPDKYVGVAVDDAWRHIIIVGKEDIKGNLLIMPRDNLRLELLSLTYKLVSGYAEPKLLLSAVNDTSGILITLGIIVYVITSYKSDSLYVGVRNDKEDRQILVAGFEYKGGDYYEKSLSLIQPELDKRLNKSALVDGKAVEIVKISVVEHAKQPGAIIVTFDNIVLLSMIEENVKYVGFPMDEDETEVIITRTENEVDGTYDKWSNNTEMALRTRIGQMILGLEETKFILNVGTVKEGVSVTLETIVDLRIEERCEASYACANQNDVPGKATIVGHTRSNNTDWTKLSPNHLQELKDYENKTVYLNSKAVILRKVEDLNGNSILITYDKFVQTVTSDNTVVSLSTVEGKDKYFGVLLDDEATEVLITRMETENETLEVKSSNKVESALRTQQSQMVLGLKEPKVILDVKNLEGEISVTLGFITKFSTPDEPKHVYACTPTEGKLGHATIIAHKWDDGNWNKICSNNLADLKPFVNRTVSLNSEDVLIRTIGDLEGNFVRISYGKFVSFTTTKNGKSMYLGIEKYEQGRSCDATINGKATNKGAILASTQDTTARDAEIPKEPKNTPFLETEISRDMESIQVELLEALELHKIYCDDTEWELLSVGKVVDGGIRITYGMTMRFRTEAKSKEYFVGGQNPQEIGKATIARMISKTGDVPAFTQNPELPKTISEIQKEFKCFEMKVIFSGIDSLPFGLRTVGNVQDNLFIITYGPLARFTIKDEATEFYQGILEFGKQGEALIIRKLNSKGEPDSTPIEQILVELSEVQGKGIIFQVVRGIRQRKIFHTIGKPESNSFSITYDNYATSSK